MEQITLASGSSYFRSPGAATAAAMAALQIGKTYYGPTEGTEALRFAISKRYNKQDIELTPGQILITPGSKQALFNLFSVLLHDKDEVVIPTPAWFGFHELMKYSKGRIVTVDTKLTEDYALTPETLRASLTEHSRILLLSNPGNPTGKIYTKTELESLLEVTAEFPDLYIIADEIYDFVTYGKPFTPILSCERAKKERTIIVNGFSKSFAMSGWRIGYMAGSADLIKKCTDFQGSTFSGVSVFIQDAAVATLEHQENALATMLPILEANRQFMRQALDAIPHVAYFFPDGAYYFFPSFKYYLNTKTPEGMAITSTLDLCKYLQETYCLAVVPGDYFGAPDHVRMSFAVEKPKLEEAMQRLQEALSQLQR
ncbi:aminotransferase class I/II-fold pyridoxal phosphate-dependent enzyme [Pontibacter silvestris]|uniref:Aminotransferase n=1 Tax=Pontibacter silvestris TaxID=2305183 RepID=A0ABW4X112_9BACT|nr:aminotransferase class I/II-fold pyridoxal phosphate-dependent enzyme [Pontibacter silvestris]MCC9135188.1 aminotransferase class I/II-fold pyridoxal phosphate-dependent enzyme [Pontibacter silvestris]